MTKIFQSDALQVVLLVVGAIILRPYMGVEEYSKSYVVLFFILALLYGAKYFFLLEKYKMPQFVSNEITGACNSVTFIGEFAIYRLGGTYFFGDEGRDAVVVARSYIQDGNVQYPTHLEVGAGIHRSFTNLCNLRQVDWSLNLLLPQEVLTYLEQADFPKTKLYIGYLPMEVGRKNVKILKEMFVCEFENFVSNMESSIGMFPERIEKLFGHYVRSFDSIGGRASISNLFGLFKRKITDPPEEQQ